MNKKDLIELGIAEDVAEKIIVLHGKDIEAHKSKLTTAEGERDGFKNQLTEANKQIEDFKKLDIDGVKKAADDWKTKYDQAVEQHANETKQRTFEAALEKGLVAAKVKDVVAVKAHLKLDGLKLNEDGTFVGLKEQLEPLQKEKDYLFEPAGDGEEEEIPSIVAGAKGTPTKTSTFEAALLKGADLKEWPQE